MTIFEKPWNLALYALSLALLALGPLLRTNWTAAAAVAAFLAWDAAYFRAGDSMHGRTVDLALQQAQNMREHLSYFLAFYGVLAGVLFTQPAVNQARFLAAADRAGIGTPLLVLPFLLASTAILFVPIQPADVDTGQPSAALKALVTASALLQKTSIFLFVHSALRLLAVLANGGA